MIVLQKPTSGTKPRRLSETAIMNPATIARLILLRQELHQYPDLSGQEEGTAKRIRSFFESLHPDEIHAEVGGEGILIVFDGNQAGPTTLLRAELDGLPIGEENTSDHRSKIPGKSHACGHDGHMAILCGLGEALAAVRPERGRVVLLFQPAEETGEGASRVIRSRHFVRINPDYAFALHNLPGYEAHDIILKKGIFTAASKGMVIHLKGSTSHAAYPEDGNSPAGAMAKIIIGLQQLPRKLEGFSLVTVVNAVLGEISFGTSPGHATIRATLRSFDDLLMEKLTGLSEELACRVADEDGISVGFQYTEAFSATENHPEAWEIAHTAATRLNLAVRHTAVPFRWSEDFGQLSSLTKTMLFGVGAGTAHPQLHAAVYDFPDEIIATGIKMFHQILRQIHH